MSAGLIIFGTGAHARKVFHAWTQGGGAVRAFADENPHAVSPCHGVAMIAAKALAAEAVPGSIFVAIGNAEVRKRLMDAFGNLGWALPAVVHPRAIVAPDAVLGVGVLVAAGAVVESGSRIGRGAIVDIGVLVDHDCEIDAYCHLRAGAVCAPATRSPT